MNPLPHNKREHTYLTTYCDGHLFPVLLFRRTGLGRKGGCGDLLHATRHTGRRREGERHWPTVDSVREASHQRPAKYLGPFLLLLGVTPGGETTEVCGSNVGCCLGICLRSDGGTWPKTCPRFFLSPVSALRLGLPGKLAGASRGFCCAQRSICLLSHIYQLPE